MQKFGLDSLKTEKLSAIELEIVKEKATSLGRAGRKLRLSIEKYNKNVSADNQENFIDEIAESVWELMLQREYSVGLELESANKSRKREKVLLTPAHLGIKCP